MLFECSMNVCLSFKRFPHCSYQFVAKQKSIWDRRFSISFNRSMEACTQDKPLIAVCQLNSKADKTENFEICKSLIEKAKHRGAEMVFLPECFDLVGESKNQSLELAEPLEGPIMTAYKQLARENGIWLSLGGFHQKGPGIDPKHLQNAHIIVDSCGNIVEVYHKVHLFDVDLPGRMRLCESDYTIAGSKIAKPVATPVGKIGMGICYDLRFPEFSLTLAKSGAEILTYPSAFTQTTGMAHWEPLLRARAIESQCYVVAAAQTGHHNKKRASYGHAMVIDPWGCVIACSKEGIDMITAEINLDYVKKVRDEMPVWMHRRPDLYGVFPSLEETDNFSCNTSYQFGQVALTPDQLFYKTRFSMAFVNKKPVIPGHVLVAPLRCAERMSDLNAVEIADLFACVQKVQRVVEQKYDAISSTIGIQDGPDAGQSIKHVHIHILPRRPGDFERNDDIYKELQSHDKTKEGWRMEEDMAKEALEFRRYFV